MAERKRRKEDEFFAGMPDPQTSQAARRLITVAEENDGYVSWERVGFSIRSRRKDFAGWPRRVSVAWIYPPDVKTWQKCKDFSFGAGGMGERGYFEGVPDYLREFLESWAQSFDGLSYVDVASNAVVIAYSVTHASAARHIDDLAERLKNVLVALQTLEPA